MRRMFGNTVKAFTVADWISLAITEHAFILLSDSYKAFICLVDPIY
jgi:hypothetical protein